MSRGRTALLLLGAVALTPSTAAAAGDGANLVWSAVNLLILLGLLFVFARKPIQAWFRDRRDQIRGDVESAAQLRSETEERYAQLQRRLADLDSDLAEIRETARNRAEAEGERIRADARAAAERIRNDARVAVEQELRRAREELRDEAADLSVELAAGILKGQVTGGDSDRLIDEFIEKIERPATPGGAEN